MLKNKVTDKPVKIFEFKEIVKKKYVEELNMNPKLIERNLNVGFSGGEKKKKKRNYANASIKSKNLQY